MWLREAFPSILPTLIINGQFTANGLAVFNGNIGVDENDSPGVYYIAPSASTRTTWGLQVQPRYGNSWNTPATGVERFTFARYPGGFVHVCGLIQVSTASLRNDGTYCFDLNFTTKTQTFIPRMEVHLLADGRDRANNNQPVFVIGTDGNARCYNLDNTSAGAIGYRINAMYNVFTEPGKWEGSGGY